jgi:ribosomal RNA-processing protein 8
MKSNFSRKPSDKVIADFGCGEARLAKSVSGNCKKIHSFGFVALNNFVTECDMASTPLSPRSVDIAVFCLSLMGVNLRDYLKEANRVLKIGSVTFLELRDPFH